MYPYGHVVGVGYPRTVGYVMGDPYMMGAAVPPMAMAPHMLPGGVAFPPAHPGIPPIMLPPQQPQPIALQTPPWRPGMMAPGVPAPGEGHVPIALTPTAFNGTWGGAAGAPAGTTISFTGPPQKPFKMTRLLVRPTKSGATAIGSLTGQIFVGTDLQQGTLGFLDLETLGAGGSFDTWLSNKQCEPGVLITVQATLTAFPTPPDFESYLVNAVGHFLH